MWTLLFCCFGLTTAYELGLGSYFITYSDYIERGMPYNVNIDILNTTDNVHVHAEIQRVWNNYTYVSRIPVVTADGDFSKGKTGTLKLKVPVHLVSGSYKLHILGSDGLNFEREDTVRVKSKAISILIQTDKAIYKPGQMVRFRAFAVYPNLQIYTGKFDVTLQDPNQNILKEWIALESISGVVSGEFQLADKALLGDWKLRVEGEEQTVTKTKPFTVDQYQLPRFEVTVDLPPYALTSDSKLSGKIKAKYTFGKPVKGMVEIHTHLNAGNDYCGRPPKYVEMAFPTDGDTEFDIPLTDIRRLQSNLEETTVVVVAIVKEELTGVRLNGSSSITFHKYPYKISVLDSSPTTFSPRLPYTAYIQVTQQDGLPVTDLTSPVGVYTCVHYKVTVAEQQDYWCSQFTGTYGLAPQNYTLPPSGIVPVDMRIPKNATSIDVMVHYRDVSDKITVNKKKSASDNYLQLRLEDKQIRAGTTASFTVEFTEKTANVNHITYELVARGIVISSGQVDVNGQNPVSISVPIITTMAPVAHIIAYYIRDNGEVIADSLSFGVEEVFDNKVSIAFSRNESRPHEDIDVVVTADSHSTVNLLAVDQSVRLLKTGNDITRKQVLTELKEYNTGKTTGDFSAEVLAISSSSTETEDIFNDAGLNVITDAWYYNHYSIQQVGPTPWPIGSIPYPGATPYAGPTPYPIGYVPYPGATPYPGPVHYPIGFTPLPGGIPPSLQGKGPGGALKEVKKVRQEFPETWLWSNATVGSDGKATIHTTVPDTITSWIASAFAVNSVTGLGVAPTTTKLRVLQPFFVSLSMPSSVLRGEQIIIQANVFNYLPSDVDVTVSLPTSSDYVNIAVDSTGKTTQDSKDQIHIINVKSNEQGSVFFPIIPSSLGVIDIEVSARSTLAADAVKRPIIVEPEGIPKEYNTPVFVELTPGGGDFNKTMSLTLPSQVVTGSEKVKVKVTGDLIGASLDSLENLLAMPTGCGEQNMMSFAPDVYVAVYLTTTNQMTPALEAKITDFLALGYQRELTYQRSDGSFSAFGERDASGSMWLTAFVTNTFHQARPYIFVGNSTLTRALQWMANRQNRDGSFNEPGLVINKQAQKSRASLTAMVLLSFVENSDMSGYGIADYLYGNTTLKAQSYLEFSSSSLTDPFDLAIVSYALAKVGSTLMNIPYNKLNAAAHVKGDRTYWTEPVSNSPSYYYNWVPPYVRGQPIDIQTTAYALLATSAHHDLKAGLPITNWLSAQRNPYGGFSSTQDTMAALQALTDYAKHTHTSGFHVELDVQAGSDSHHLSVNDKNALVLQSRYLTSFPNEVSVTATGKGVAYAEVDVFFNVEAEIGEPAFDISTVLLDDTLNTFRLMLCTKWRKQGASGMAVMEISIPTGFDPDMTSIGNVAGIKRTERRGRNVVVYFNEISTTSICFDFLSSRTSKVTNNQDSYVKVYDYYQPDNQASVFYQTRSIRKATICDVCEKCCPQTP